MDKELNQACSSSSKRKAKAAFEEEKDDSEAFPCSDDEEEGECKVVERTKFSTILGYQVKSPTIKEIKSIKAVLNNKLSSKGFLEEFSKEWSSNKPLISETHEIIIDPFKVCVLNNLFEDDSILKAIRQEFYEIDWNRRKMDLYDFHQSCDLKHLEAKNITNFFNFLKETMMPWVSRTMNFNLHSVSATCSYYSDTDYLLIHDDLRGDRVVAFVLYFSDVQDWDQSWGGSLQLLSCTDLHQPHKTIREIYPVNNQLVLFPVSSTSYHQVDEVTQKNFSRYSINGWFHGDVNNKFVAPIYKEPTEGLFSTSYDVSKKIPVELSEWIWEDYLDQHHIKSIQNLIEENSEISLPNYFVPTKYLELCNEFENESLKWDMVGPPNRFRYEVLPETEFTKPIKELVDIFKSESMFKLLKCYTELDLDDEKAGIKYEVQRWKSGHYSLLSDFKWNTKELDVIIYFNCNNQIIGGQTQYVTEDEEIQQALITLTPENNSLNIVFRDTARITTYISKYTKEPFYALFCSYVEDQNKI
ncbi:prolyl 3-hydroxylase sudestada1 [Onthophagus taurus]|uniref:prolyl 3-hydroxylase sudestada1 n=1 Tax=Onthophagus taurus TaxID=166361 RepID=UPI0039BDFE67